MLHRSLTARIALLFMLALTGVLLTAGLVVSHLTRLHFIELDAHILHGKLHAIEQQLAGITSVQEVGSRLPALHTLLAAHDELQVELLDAQGQPLLQLADPPLPAHLHQPSAELWEWQEDGLQLRGLTRHIELATPGQSLRLLLAIDTTHHEHFFHLLLQWLWIALAICLLLSAGLGGLVAWLSLRPLREVTAVAAQVSASSLQQRIPGQRVPAELQPLVQTINAMLERLDAAFVRLSAFSADIAHELRTPLTRLITHNQVMLGQARTAQEYQEVLYGGLEDLEAMARMIDDMLYLARTDNGLQIPQQQPLALHVLVDDLLEFFQPLAEDGGLQLQRQGEAQVAGDAAMLRRALSNLLGNALQHTPAGGCIRTCIGQQDGQLQIAVENPGEPIPPALRERLFDRFYRLDPARSASGHAGLGLAITRSIISAHGGQIRCESAEGVNRFILTLPLADTPSLANPR